MTAPDSKPYENEKIFKYIKDKAKKQEIEIDMDAVEKFAKNTKGYTKK
jgi:DNA helicase TIP49 (TBP-interacting protein)